MSSWFEVPDLAKLAASAQELANQAQNAASEAAAAASNSVSAAAAAAEKSATSANLHNLFSLDNLQTEAEFGADGAIIPPSDEDSSHKSKSAELQVKNKPVKSSNASSTVEMEKLEAKQKELVEELQNYKAMYTTKDNECQKLQLQVNEGNQLLESKQSESAALKSQLSDANEALQSEKEAVLTLRTELKESHMQQQSAQEKFEDEMLQSRRQFADLQEQFAISSAESTAKIDSLQRSVHAALTEDHSASARSKEEDSTVSSASTSSPSPDASGKGKGKGKGKGRGGTTASTGAGNGAPAPAPAPATAPAPAPAADSPVLVQLRTDLASSESKRSALEEKLESLRVQLREMEDKNTAAVRKCKRIEEQLASAQATNESSSSSLTTRISSLANDLAEKNTELAKVQGQLTELRAEVAVKAKAVTELEATAEAKTKAIENSKSQTSSLQAELVEAQSAIVLKDTTIADLQSKLSGLTDKTKDLMKKYADSKTKIQGLEQAEGSKASDSQKTLQGKESELLSLRLKLENLERSAGDQRALSAELADRYGETQRELTRAKNTIAEQMLQIQELQKELEGAVSATSGLATDAAAAQEKVDEEKAKVAKLQEKNVALLMEWQGKMAEATKTHATKVTELKLENETLLMRLKSEDESGKALEEYKKRAQVALKKANSSKAALDAEILEKQKVVDDALARLAEAEASSSRSLEVQQAQTEALGNTQRHLEELQKKFDFSLAEKATLERALELEKQNSKDLSEQYDTLVSASNQPARKPETFSESPTDQQEQESKEDAAQNESRAAPATPSWAVAAAAAHATPLPTAKPQAPSTPSSPSLAMPSSVAPVEESIRIDDGLALQAKGPSMLVSKLQSQIEELKREIAMRGIDLDASQQELQSEREAKVRPCIES